MVRSVELVYLPVGLPAVHLCLPYVVGMTVADVLQQTALTYTHPEVRDLPVGIFSQRVALTHLVQPGDRVEVYPSLLICPKEKRRKRASGC